MVTVIFRAKMKAGKEEQAVEAMSKMASAVEAGEKDTLVYLVCRNQQDPSELLVIECYKDEDAFKAHTQTSHMGEMRTAFAECFEGPGTKIERLERVAGVARG